LANRFKEKNSNKSNLNFVSPSEISQNVKFNLQMFDRERYSFQSMNQVNKVSVEGVQKTMINSELLKNKILSKLKKENIKIQQKNFNDDLESDYIKVDINDQINQSLFSSQVNEGG